MTENTKKNFFFIGKNKVIKKTVTIHTRCTSMFIYKDPHATRKKKKKNKANQNDRTENEKLKKNHL